MKTLFVAATTFAGLSLFAPTQAAAQTADPPACGPYRAQWAGIAGGENVAAMKQSIANIPSLCPMLTAEAKARQATVVASISARDPCTQARNAWNEKATEEQLRDYLARYGASCEPMRQQADSQLAHVISLRTNNPKPTEQFSIGSLFGGALGGALGGQISNLPVSPTRIVIAARNYTRGTNIGISACVPDAGLLTNAKPCNSTLNVAEYDIIVKAPARYALFMQYAALTPRPVKIMLNGQVIAASALAKTTGGWGSANITSSGAIAPADLRLGMNTLRIEGTGDGVFPTLDEITFEPNG